MCRRHLTRGFVFLSCVPRVLYRLSSLGALSVPLIADLLTSRTAFCASLTVSRSDDQALWADATIIAASLFGRSVNRWTRSSSESRIFVCRRYTESITAGLAARAQRLIGNISCFVPLSLRSQAWHSLQQRGVCNLETTNSRVDGSR